MKTRSLFVLTILVAFLLTACSPVQAAIQTSQAVQIPLELKMAINGAILFVVMFGLQWLFDLTNGKLELRGIGAALAVGISEFAILQFQGLIDVIPAQYDLYVALGLNVLLAILTSLGFFQVFFHKERAAALLK